MLYGSVGLVLILFLSGLYLQRSQFNVFSFCHIATHSTITDLIDEERQTLGALNDARGSIQDLHATNERIDQQQEERNAAGNAFESDLFGGSAPVPMGDPAPAPVPVPEPEPEAPVPAPVLAEPVPAPVPVEQPAAPAPSEYMQASAPQYGGYMGGAPPAAAPSYEPQQPEMVPMGGMSVTNAPASLNPGSFSHNSSMGLSESLSTEEIDVIKQQVTELDRKAVAAEDSQRQLISQVEYLRREAEQAEVDAAEKVSAAEGTKKKRFGKSGKKGAMVRYFDWRTCAIACRFVPRIYSHLSALPSLNSQYHRKMPIPRGRLHLKGRRLPRLLRPPSATLRPRPSRPRGRRMSSVSEPRRQSYRPHRPHRCSPLRFLLPQRSHRWTWATPDMRLLLPRWEERQRPHRWEEAKWPKWQMATV